MNQRRCDMKYFIYSKDRKGTMYWEFFRGTWNVNKNGWWNEDSICLDWFFYKEIESFIFKVNPTYDPYGETEISKAQWEQIEKLALAKGGLSALIVKEAEAWMHETFRKYNVLVILNWKYSILCFRNTISLFISIIYNTLIFLFHIMLYDLQFVYFDQLKLRLLLNSSLLE